MHANGAFDSSLFQLCPGSPSGMYDSAFAAGIKVPLAVQPKRGRAVVFWQESEDGQQILHDMFHAGCDVRAGLKVAFQKFKHFPRHAEGCSAGKSLWCSLSQAS